MKISTKKMTLLALFTALAAVFSLLIRVPLVPSVSFLSYDPKDVVIGIGGFLFGPLSAFIVSVLTSLIEIFLRGGNLLDVVMNVISTSTFICTASWIYKRNHTRSGALTGLSAGTIVNILSMLLWNYVIDPIYFGMPREAVVSMLPWIALFNLLKCGINSGILLVVYKPIVRALRSSGIVQKEQDRISHSKSMMVIGLFLILTAIVVILSLNGTI